MTSQPTTHHGKVIVLPGERRTFVCCDGAGSRFETTWNQSGSKASAMVWGTPSETFDKIVKHLVQGSDDDHVRTAVEAAALVVALSGDIDDGIRVLDEQLANISMTFEPRPDTV